MSATDMLDGGRPEEVVLAVAGWKTNMLARTITGLEKNPWSQLDLSLGVDRKWTPTRRERSKVADSVKKGKSYSGPTASQAKGRGFESRNPLHKGSGFT